MIVARAWAGKRYAVLGLARSGAATVRALVAGGASVVGWDEGESSSQALFEELKDDRERLGTPPGFTLKNWLLATDLTGFEAIVVSPGVPLNRHPVAEKAARYGIPVIGDIELFAQARADLPPHKVVGITGTNGKSTTTALVHHILQTAGMPSLMGGNIGLPILGQEPLPAGGVYVLELSSYQIDLTHSLDCDVAVLTNITPDHLDRYEGFEAYAASKARLFAMQSPARFAVLGTDDGQAARLHDRERDRRAAFGDVVFATEALCPDDPVYNPWLGDRFRQEEWPALRGPHNAQNASRAIATCSALEVDDDDIEQALRTFTGLPHRMERIATLDGLTFVDDSKATNPESAAPALAAYPRVPWIVGGRAKGDDLDACLPHLSHVVRAYTIGEAGPRFAAVLRAGGASVADCGTLPVAVNAAWSAARPGETVLLSPAAASFDQFADYAARGLAFRREVEALTPVAAT